jgi:outer membrane protein
MFRRAVLILMVLIGFVFLGNFLSYAQEYKLAFIDIDKVFDSYKKTKDLEQVLKDKTEAKQKKRDELVNEIKSLREELQLLKDEKRREKEAVIEEKLNALQGFDQQVRSELQRERDRMLRDILSDIDKAVETFGKKNSYTFIFNGRMLLYKNASLDVTNKIIKNLNAQYKK